jgi:tocopherol cyclase
MDFLRRLRATWYPDEFHGWGLTRRYFEGWYYKMVSPDGAQAYAVIPGISHGADGQSHAFIQVMDGTRCRAVYHRFEVQEFQPSAHTFELRLGRNYFSKDRLQLHLPDFQADIHMSGLSAWPKMLGAPGIMGWYSFVPFMQCFHGIVSMDHRLEGYMSGPEAGRTEFSGGKGYMEKDWGRSFPKAYVWMQCNHFVGMERSSLIASVAHIPWLGSYFIGFISGFLLEGRLFKFATYTGARKYLRLEGEHLELIYRSSRQELRIRAAQAPGTALISPVSGEMTGKINESLQATLQVELWEKGQRIFEGIGQHAGLEVAGQDLSILTDPAFPW